MYVNHSCENLTLIKNCQVRVEITITAYLILIIHFAKQILCSFNTITVDFLFVSELRLSKLELNTGWVKNLIPSLYNKGEYYWYLYNEKFLTFWAACSSQEQHDGIMHKWSFNQMPFELNICIPFNCKYSTNCDHHPKDNSLDFLYVKSEDISSKVCTSPCL